MGFFERKRCIDREKEDKRDIEITAQKGNKNFFITKRILYTKF